MNESLPAFPPTCLSATAHTSSPRLHRWNRYHRPAYPDDVLIKVSVSRGLVMTASSSSSSAVARAAGRARRSSVLPALLIGVPLAAAILAVLYSEPLMESKAHEYVKNPVECVEVVMFCVALGALGTKLI